MAPIRVDHADNWRPSRIASLDDRRPEPELAAAVNHLDAMPRCQIVGQRPGPVRRIVVHDDELTVEAPPGERRKDGVDEIPEAIALVVSRDDDGQCGRWGGGQRMRLACTITQPLLAFLHGVPRDTGIRAGTA